jgi:acyl-CoA thioesterase FadM
MYVEGKSENKLVATANTTYVVVDSKTYRKASIPESMRTLFAADLNAHIDQAGV